MLMEFCSNAEFYEIAFLFGGPNGQNKGFLTSYPNIIDRIKVIEILRRHTFSTDRLSYYQDLQDAGFIYEIVPDKWGRVEYLGFDLMLYNFELASVNLSLAALSQIANENWSNDIKLAASIWLFGISDRYCRQLTQWGYSDEYKLSLEIERNRKYLDKIMVRPPSADEKERITVVKTKYNAGAKRNAAYAYGSIDGQKVDFECISGVNGGANFKKVNSTDYHFSGLPSYDYVYHTEQDIIEYVYSVYKNNTTVSGTITVVSERNFCMNCWEILSQFQAEFPNIDIVRVFVQ